jgi:SAM-dependent methyltransferase
MAMQVDFGKTSQDYGRYRAGFPPAFFDRLQTYGVGKPGQRVLDLGTGTGTLARGLAMRGCTVTGLDPATTLMEEAQRLDQEVGVTIHYVCATAEQSGLPDATFDVVTAGQCWHWFDRPRAAAEVRRLLVLRGFLVIAHFDWIPLPGNVVEATEQLIATYNPVWKLGGGRGIYPEWLRDVGTAGFEDIETFSFDVQVSYSHEAWRGRIRASAGVAASLSPHEVSRFDTDLQQLLAARFPDDPLAVPHRVFALITRAPAGEHRA